MHTQDTKPTSKREKKSKFQRPFGSMELLKKGVGVVHISGRLTLNMRKMANVLLLNAYDNLLNRDTHTISVAMLCGMLGFESENIDALRQSIAGLASTSIQFNQLDKGKERWSVMAMLSFGEIKDGVCTYRYDRFLAEKMYNPEMFVLIDLAVQKELTSVFSLALYENCARFKRLGSPGWWSIMEFRNLVGATSGAYDEFKILQRDVIKKAILQINSVTDLMITPEYQKEGRKITGVRFLIEINPQKSILLAPDQENIKINGKEVGFDDLRATTAFKRLRDHNIGERLALSWVSKGEAQVLAVLNYVEEKDRAGTIKGSVSGYLKSIIEAEAVLGASNYEQNKKLERSKILDTTQREKAEIEYQRQKEAFLRHQKKVQIDSISGFEMDSYAKQYLDSLGQEGEQFHFDSKINTINSPMQQIKFRMWLQKTILTHFDPKLFEEWLAGETVGK